MKRTVIRSVLALGLVSALALGGCASPFPPSADALTKLPVVTYPDKPAGKSDYIYKLPAGQRIDVRLLVDGSALTMGADQAISARLGRDLYLHKQWASEDGRHWVDAKELVGVNLSLRLPGYETPGPGELHLSVNRKMPR
ncbi:hypothetical protein [uncultured Sphaerotilus sp.]|uniref:hypothetical protein n=1 Tax=uncultured Sphaerotilus sp. TaxID=474984 RepID=UPI0030CA134A